MTGLPLCHNYGALKVLLTSWTGNRLLAFCRRKHAGAFRERDSNPRADAAWRRYGVACGRGMDRAPCARAREDRRAYRTLRGIRQIKPRHRRLANLPDGYVRCE